ncbi:MAG: hypothetical protein SFU85_11520 [Candidatus Methylacidiphilales bacterium]|nr:hypothetical protein [Candidatus Methylacidiphilales bacterium]
MKTNCRWLTLVILFQALVGCGPSGDKQRAGESSRDHGPETRAEERAFIPGKGLKVSPVALAGLGVAAEEVGTGKVAPQRTLTAQVFRQAGEQSVEGRYRLGHAYATALIPSEDHRWVQAGQTVRLSTGSSTDLIGTISRLDTQLQELNGQTELILEINPGDEPLPVGSSLTLLLSQPAEQSEETVIIPQEAVLKTAKGSFAYVENAGYYLRTPVRTGAVNGEKIQVLDGLYEGDVVVVRGAQELYLTELQAVNAGTGCTHGH